MTKTRYINRFNLLIVPLLLALFLLDGCTAYRYTNASRDVEEVYPGLLEGYLSFDELPNSLKILPPPTEMGSAAFDYDIEVTEASLLLRDSLRWHQARYDANLSFPGILDAFGGLYDTQISKERTPYLYVLLQRTLMDAALSTYAAKSYYNRSRPFMINEQPVCTPEVVEQLTNDGSYPSGHAAIGWAWALILSEISPEHADAILLRGREFGESRIICNVHWYSDVVAGRSMGASTVAALHGDREFLKDLKKAKREVQKLKTRQAVTNYTAYQEKSLN